MSKIIKRKPLSENEFYGAPGGSAGTVNYGVPYGTPSGPNQTQDPDHFAKSDQNKAVNQNSNTAKDLPRKTGSNEQDLDAIYSKKDTPSVDEIISGIKYELGQQIKKNKGQAKEKVLGNLKKNPHFYSELQMLNIDDKAMVDNMTENKHPNNGIDIQVFNKLQELKQFKTTDYIGLRLMREQLVRSLTRLKDEGKINFDGNTASLKPMTENKHPNDKPLAHEKLTPNIAETKKIFAEMAKGKEKKYVVNSQIVDVMKEMWEAKKARNAWRG